LKVDRVPGETLCGWTRSVARCRTRSRPRVV